MTSTVENLQEVLRLFNGLKEKDRQATIRLMERMVREQEAKTKKG